MGIDSTMYGLAKASLDELGPEDVVMPDDFVRVLGASGIHQ